MTPTLTQTGRPLRITTPLGEDALVLTAFRGHETISRLFCFQAELLADSETAIDFDRILGQDVTVEIQLPDGEKRYFNGLVRRFTQAGHERSSGEGAFLRFRAELVPRLWMLTKRVGCRTFQQLSVPAILERVLAGLDVCYELSGSYPARDYCVQFRESDFDFVSRLMEEEGIYYYFKHAANGHQLVITDGKNPFVSGQSVVLFGEASSGVQDDMRITTWEKTQELRAGEYVLRDHCFQLPANHLEANLSTIDSIAVGKVTHKLRASGNQRLEIYEYPGGYAKRFDGIGPSGNPRPEDLEHLYQDRERTVRIRMEQEEVASLEISGTGDCGHFGPGYRFTLARHFDGDGRYLLTRVEHEAHQAGYRSGQAETFSYENRFKCIPEELPFRSQRVTPKPVIPGVETATVTGPQGEEIFCEKYGRVKVQFHWDREGKMDGASSCWLRVAQIWAGKGWGAFFWPRVGHEVVVAFEDGDPDRPLIVGSLYNAENMPFFGLPVNKQLAGFKSASVRGQASKNFNGIVFNDRKGQEHLAVHSERNLSLNSELDRMIHGGRHKGERVGVASMLTVGKLVPGGGGGSGGGDFDEGNPISAPPPYGVVGLNSVFTFGDNMQAACPLNHQLTIGNNMQLCINPVGLAAGVPGMPSAGTMQAVLGSGMGGSMQFTIGTSAQFTLGQSFEISVGPPKIEIHDDPGKYGTVRLFCGMLGAAAFLFGLGYDLSAHLSPKETPNETTDAAAQAEQPGDQTRSMLVLLYQVVADLLLVAILDHTSMTNDLEWRSDDMLKQLWGVEQSILEVWKAPVVTPDPADPRNCWQEWGALSFGSAGALALLGVEVLAAAEDLGN